MTKYEAPPASFHFKRAKPDGLVLVLNEGWYVMAEYSELTGQVKWQRVVLATQREKIEKHLREQYPIHAPSCSPVKAKRRK
jgi:hypothetical protein